jgi:hypothetical protein
VTTPSIEQDGYGVYFDDGTEATATEWAAFPATTTINIGTQAAPYTYHIRLLIIEDVGMSGGELTTPNFEYNHQAGGWLPITTSSSVVRAISSNLTDGANTTQRLGAGSFIATNAWVTDDGSMPTLVFGASQECEAVLSCYVIYDDVADGEEIQIRLSNLDVVNEVCDLNVSKSGIIGDDFSSGSLQGFWTKVDPNGNGTISFEGAGTVDARAVFELPAGQNDTDTSAMEALQLRQSISNTDFQIVAKFDTVMDDTLFKSYGLLVVYNGAPDTYIQYVGFHDGTGMQLNLDNDGASQGSQDISLPTAPFWMRLTRTGDAFFGAYSLNGISFTDTSNFTDTVTVTEVAVMSGNFDPAHTSKVDYFWETLMPIIPEDEVVAPPGDTRVVVIS